MRGRRFARLAMVVAMVALAPELVHAERPSEAGGETLRPRRPDPERGQRTGPGSPEQWDSLSREERKRLRRLDAEARRAEKRARFESMSDEERRALRLGVRGKQGGPDRRPHPGPDHRPHPGWKADIEALAPGEREALREDLRGLPPEERRAVLRDRFGDPKPPPDRGSGRPDHRRRAERYLDSLPEEERAELRSELEGLDRPCIPS